MAGVIDPTTAGVIVDSLPDPNSIIAVCGKIANVVYTKSPHLCSKLIRQYEETDVCLVFSTAEVILLFCGLFYCVTVSKLASNGSVIGEFENIWKESRCLVEVLSLHLPGRTEEKHEEPQVK